VSRIAATIKRTIGATKILARDSRIPRPLRLITGVALLPIPGPLDEAVLVLTAPIFGLLYREEMREAWERASLPHPASEPEDLSM
jgi:hypothetical protein